MPQRYGSLDRSAMACWMPRRIRRDGSVPGVDEYQSGVGMADRNRQRGLQRVKELLHVARAEAPADPKPRDLGIADDDAGIGVALDLGDCLRQGLTIEDDGAFAPCEFARHLLRSDWGYRIVAARGGPSFSRHE